MLYLAFYKKNLIKKKSFEQKILKFFIVCSLFLQELSFQVSALALSPNFYNFTKFLLIIFMYSLNYVNNKRCFKSN